MRIQYVILHAVLLLTGGTNLANADLLAYWSFNNVTGGMVRDEVRGRHGRFHGTAATINSRFGNALDLDGKSGYVSVKNHRTFDVSRPFSVSVWAKVAQLTRKDQTIISKGISAWTLSRHNKTDFIRFAGNNPDRYPKEGWALVGETNINDNKWHHYAAVYTVSQASLYIDSKRVASMIIDKPINVNPENVCIGFGPDQGRGQVGRGRYWPGLVDDVLMFDHALTEQEVVAIYESDAETFVIERMGALHGVVGQIDALLEKHDPGRVVSFINQKLMEFRRLKEKSRQKVTELHTRVLSDIYSRLAQAQALQDISLQEIAKTYQTLVLLGFCSEHCTPALVWLHKYSPKQEYLDIVRGSLRSTNKVTWNLSYMAGDFAGQHDWPAFQLFVEAVLSDTPNANGYAWALWKGLSQETNWANRLLEYSREIPTLNAFFRIARSQQAETALQHGRHRQAERLFRDVLNYCKSPRDRAQCEYRICECLMKEGRHLEAITALDSFIHARETISDAHTRKAILLKGRAYLQQNKIVQAQNIFQQYTSAYPNTERSPEAFFLLAYCQMLLKRPQGASASVQTVYRDYPDSSSAILAALSLDRLIRVREKGPINTGR